MFSIGLSKHKDENKRQKVNFGCAVGIAIEEVRGFYLQHKPLFYISILRFGIYIKTCNISYKLPINEPITLFTLTVSKGCPTKVPEAP